MSLNTIVDLVITLDSKAPTQEGFGTPLLFGYHTAWLDDRVRLYEEADEMLEDGFTADDDLYMAAKIVKSQKPSPSQFKIGRRVTPLTQVIEIVPTITTQGFKYKGTIGGKTLSYTVLASASVSSICTALASAINALSAGTTAVASSTKVTCTAGTAGEVVSFDLGGGMQITDATADTTTDDELPGVLDDDSDWYGLIVVDSSSKATILLVAAYIEAIRKIYTFQTADTNVLDGNEDEDVLTALKDSSYSRSVGIYHRAIGGVEWLAAGWQAGRLTSQPGSDTWAFKTVTGVKVDKLLAAHEAAILAKNGSHYTNTGGLNITFEGKTPEGEYIDTTRFVDWQYARQREAVLATLATPEKVPFTDDGVDMVRSALSGVLQQGENVGGFKKDPKFKITAPKVANVSVAMRKNRTLPDISWEAELAGAIHRVGPIRGRISV